MSKVRHILGISGGKDSAALAIYLNELYPSLDIDYYTSDTGRELDETYRLIDRLESKMGRPIKRLDAVDLTNIAEKSPFDHFLQMYGGYLPSSTSRWCTKKLKLDPFEKYISDEPTISYVGIRGDEDRDGYISRKQSVQSIFPFRRNIWSEDVNKLILSNSGIVAFKTAIESTTAIEHKEKFLQIADKLISPTFTQKQKLNSFLDISVKSYNHVVFELLKQTDYPIGKLDYFPIIDNEENLVIDDIFRILEESGVGVPAYYKPLEYEVVIDGEIRKGMYSRSRSGFFFCFFQQKIEWVWLFETHRDLYEQAMQYEKDGYSWTDTETLDQLAKPERIAQIKKDHFIKTHRNNQQKSWKDQILDAEGDGCVSCFV
jgi:3'-phosphoadenosine 5'-phosphosulfate sulfotransferase (PAPS reductase)/FAD synthetase